MAHWAEEKGSIVTSLAITLFWIQIVLTVAGFAVMVGFVRLLRRWKPAPNEPNPAPRVAVVMCLRGADPFLRRCLDGLLTQDYPHYRVVIVVDSRDDPGWALVERARDDHPECDVRLLPLTERRRSCSLKCSSLLQAIGGLEPGDEVVAQLDSDTEPHPTWLRELVAPLADPQVGASTGNRWYMPQDGSWGSLVRYLWNAAAVVQMYWYRIAWGGSLAVKRSVFDSTDLLERWGTALAEDTMIQSVLERGGLRLAFAPSILMINRESCDLGSFLEWVRRQLLIARLYHPAWPGVVLHALVTSLTPLTAAVVWAAAWATGQHTAAAWAGWGLLLYMAFLPPMLWPLELAVRRIVRARGEKPPPIRWAIVGKTLLAIPLTQLVYPVAVAGAVFLRRVRWRGVTYRVDGSQQIEMVEEVRPVGEANHPTANASL